MLAGSRFCSLQNPPVSPRDCSKTIPLLIAQKTLGALPSNHEPASLPVERRGGRRRRPDRVPVAEPFRKPRDFKDASTFGRGRVSTSLSPFSIIRFLAWMTVAIPVLSMNVSWSMSMTTVDPDTATSQSESPSAVARSSSPRNDTTCTSPRSTTEYEKVGAMPKPLQS